MICSNYVTSDLNLVVLIVLLDTAPKVELRIQNVAKNQPQPPHAVLAYN